MWRIYYFIFINFLLFISCQTNYKENKEKILNITFEQKSIFLNGKGTEWYNSIQFKILDNTLYLLGFTNKNNMIDFFDLENEMLVKSCYFEEDGPNGIGVPSNFYFQDEEHIYFESARFLSLINLEGKVKKRIRIWQQNTSQDSLANDTNPIHIPSYFPFYIDSITAEMYYARTAYIDRQMFINYNENSKIIGKLNWKTEKTEDLPIYLPDFYLNKEEYFGSAYNPQLCLWGDKLIINYQTSSKIFVYNQLDKQMQEYNLPSSYTSNQLRGIPISAREDFIKINQNLNRGTRFYPLYHDKFNGFFYRFHEAKAYNDLGEMIKRDIYLMIMNENFELLQEEKMPYTVNNPTLCLVLPEGGLLVGVAGDQVREDHLTYNLVKLKKIIKN